MSTGIKGSILYYGPCFQPFSCVSNMDDRQSSEEDVTFLILRPTSVFRTCGSLYRVYL
jgi:hypothetical protein